MSRSQMTRRAGTVVTMIALLAGQAQAEPGKAKVRLTVQDRWTVQIERDLPTALAFHPQSRDRCQWLCHITHPTIGRRGGRIPCAPSKLAEANA